MKSKAQAEASGMQGEHRLTSSGCRGVGCGGHDLCFLILYEDSSRMLHSRLSYLLARHLDCLSFRGGGLLVSVGNSPSLKEASRPLSSEQGWMGICGPQTSVSPYALLFSQE